ncbi:MAG: GGDEF and EAL domain-containing protein [Lachnospiraceae bacterium]|nr:GGDEF and EAL domain-containing protein [Lachnospiraceae bacterium]
MQQTPEERKIILDEMFQAFSIASEGAYAYVCDLKTDISRWSDEAVAYFNMPGTYMKHAGQIWGEHLHPEDRQRFHEDIEAILNGQVTSHDMQYRAMNADGDYVVCTCKGVALKDPEGNPNFFGGVIRNHGSHSHIDPVTGLRNQYGFFEELRSLTRVRKPCNVLMIGISRFSEINNVYGYAVGNRVLQTLARSLEKCMGDDGKVYRMDGARFALLSTVLSEEEFAVRYRERKADLVSGYIVDDNRYCLVTNGGMLRIDCFDVGEQAIYACLNYAYDESKDRQRGELVIFHNTINRESRKKLEMVHVIRDCIVDNCRGFYLCYQPIMDTETERLSGMEALIRWRDEKYGEVPPNDFIPIVEKDILFPKLGDWILRQAMLDGKKFLTRYPEFVMNVNLSYAQMEKADFARTVLDIIEETGFPASNLCLEITERCRLLDLDMLRGIITTLRSHGIRFALDDFGTGYSSISILRELPLDVVKIDREFVKDIEKDKHSMDTVEHISGLASVYGSHVCAEGIESAAMRDHLRKFSVNSLQGFYYSKPVPFDRFLEANIS